MAFLKIRTGIQGSLILDYLVDAHVGSQVPNSAQFSPGNEYLNQGLVVNATVAGTALSITVHKNVCMVGFIRGFSL